jgi:tetratricopeptide (TPR) repeat protein
MTRSTPIISVFFLILLSLSAPAAAQLTSPQDPLPQEAQVVLDEARMAIRDALEIYSSPHPDQPLFREAIRLSRRAVYLAPESPETLRFLAEVYGLTGFYGPAFSIWQRFANANGTLDAAARTQLAESGMQVGYARYTQGDLEGALSAYRTVTRLAPATVPAQHWVGRILLEQNRPEAALPYWRRVQELRPNDAGAGYFLELSRAGIAHGLAAARAFYGGVSDYEAGRRGAAREKFLRATALSPGYAEAWGYLGRLAFEAGNFARAETAYARASALAPQNQTYRYFLEQSQNRQTPPGPRD